jgi:hypothetical protein
MIFNNFKLEHFSNQQIIEINYLDEVYDLHNASEFLKFEYDIKNLSLILFWNYYKNDGTIIIPFQIIFEEVTFFEVMSRDDEMPKEEDSCLEQIINNEKMIFSFMGGMKIIVGARTARLTKG